MFPEPDVKQYGLSIYQTLLSAVPDGFREVIATELEPREIVVGTIDSIYRGLYGFPNGHLPVTLEKWASIVSGALCFASSGFLIYDPSGVLAERMSEFRNAYYPTDIWKWQIAAQLWDIWHYGAYNLCDRRDLARGKPASRCRMA